MLHICFPQIVSFYPRHLAISIKDSWNTSIGMSGSRCSDGQPAYKGSLFPSTGIPDPNLAYMIGYQATKWPFSGRQQCRKTVGGFVTCVWVSAVVINYGLIGPHHAGLGTHAGSRRYLLHSFVRFLTMFSLETVTKIGSFNTFQVLNNCFALVKSYK